MSLDNVLAVAGAARDHPVALIFGLALSIVLMGVAASFIARLLNRHRWIAYIGLAIILYVAGDMIWRGALEVWPHGSGEKPEAVSARARAGEAKRPEVNSIFWELCVATDGRSRNRPATRRAIAGAGSSQSTCQGALARKRSSSNG